MKEWSQLEILAEVSEESWNGWRMENGVAGWKKLENRVPETVSECQNTLFQPRSFSNVVLYWRTVSKGKSPDIEVKVERRQNGFTIKTFLLFIIVFILFIFSLAVIEPSLSIFRFSNK